MHRIIVEMIGMKNNFYPDLTEIPSAFGARLAILDGAREASVY